MNNPYDAQTLAQLQKLNDSISIKIHNVKKEVDSLPKTKEFLFIHQYLQRIERMQEMIDDTLYRLPLYSHLPDENLRMLIYRKYSQKIRFVQRLQEHSNDESHCYFFDNYFNNLHKFDSNVPYYVCYDTEMHCSSIRELQEIFGCEHLLVTNHFWDGYDLCLYVERTDADYAYGTRFLDGKPYNEHYRYNVDSKRFYLYTGPSKESVLRQVEKKQDIV